MEIITYGGGLQLNALFTALAAFTDTGDFLGAIRLMLLISSFVIAAEIAFTGTLKPAPRLLIAIFVIYASLFSRVDVNIIDRVSPADSTTVDDVPAGVAVVAHYASVTGDWFTTSFETVFSMPDDIRYQNNGLLFANRLLQASTEMEIADPIFANNMAEFMRSCVYYGANAGWFDWQDLMQSTNTWNYIVSQGVGSAIFTAYDDGSGPTLVPCSDAITDLNTGWTDAVNSSADVFGMRIFGDPDVTAANAKLLSTLPIAYDYLGGISATGAEIVQQNVMLNAMRRSFTTMAAEADATAAIQDFALGQAEAQQRTTYSTLGALAARTLPLIKNILEMLIYALFPLLLLLVIVSMFPGKIVIFYAKALIWLHLWPPLYAVLHFAMSVYSVGAVSAAVNVPASVGGAGAGLAVVTQGGLNAVNADMAMMAGYLAWLIPLLAWGIMSAGGFAMSQLAAGIGSVAQSAGSSAAGAGSTGQISLGNMRLMTSTMFATNTAPQSNTGVGTQTDPETGLTTTTAQNGNQYINTLQHNTGLSTGLSRGIQSSVSERASASQTAANQDVKQYAELSAANLNNTMGFTHSVNSSLSSSDTSGFQFSASVNEKADAIQTGLQSLSDRHGVSVESALRASITASAGGKVPLTELGLKGEIARSGSAANRAFLEDVRQFAEQTNFSESWGQVLQASESLSSAKAASIGDSDSQGVQASLLNAVRAQESSSASMSEARAWEGAASRIEQSGFSSSFDAVGAIRDSMIGTEKGAVTIGSSSPTWTSNDVDNLFQSAAAGNTNAMQILLNESQRFGEERGLELAGVSSDVGGPTGVQSFNSSGASDVAGGGSVGGRHNSNTDAVLYNSSRAGSDLPGQESNVKSDALRAESTVDLIKSTTDGELQKLRSDLGDEGDSAAAKQSDWREANLPGAIDDWVPGLDRP